MSQKTKKSVIFNRPFRRTALVIAASFCAASVMSAPMVSADSYQNQIDALNAQNAQTQSSVSSLQLQASNYQQAISQLQGRINGLQGLINKNHAEQTLLQQQIQQEQIKLNQEKSVLAADIKAMYVDGQMTTIEELATSKDLSAFVDAETYRNAVQSEVQNTMNEITTLQNQLQTKKTKVDLLVKDEQAQQSQLDSDQQQQQHLLSMNQAQQAAYTQQIQANNAKISQLQAEEAAAHARLMSSGNVTPVSSSDCGGGYPDVWCQAPQDSLVDNWGMLNRECVSYTAWKVYQTYGDMPYWGNIDANADAWPGDAQAYGIPTGNTPKVHSVAIGTDPYYFGPVGHAMWVEAISGNQILVSEYNWVHGEYSTMWLSSSLISTYIYFH